MLDATSSPLAHRARDLALIILSLLLFPLDSFLLFISLQLARFRSDPYLQTRKARLADPTFTPKTVLVTGVGMTKGLAIARMFYLAGHDVIGADFEPGGALVCGRVSKAIRKFYRLRTDGEEDGGSYLEGLLDVVVREKVDLWVSCSGVASAVEDGVAGQVVEARTKCRAIQYDAATTRVLHEKHSFVERVAELGLIVPETRVVTSRAEVEGVLSQAPPGRRYILKTVGMDDSARGDMTLLPRENRKDTSAHIARLRIGKAMPWIVQQYIDGVEFCTHALVVRGHVKAFVACPSAELLMHYESLDTSSPLSKAMLSFTTTFADKSGPDFTGHLSFDFLVERDDLLRTNPDDVTLYPIECNPRAHTAVALFNGTSTGMVDAYFSALQDPEKPSYADVVDVDPARHVVFPLRNDRYYWIGHDLMTLLLIPFMDLISLRIKLFDFITGLDLLADHLLTWRDGTFEVWDPFPCWWLYHVYWPLRFWEKCRLGRKWSRVNVSTGKMFEC